jgi:hypothetical protein
VRISALTWGCLQINAFEVASDAFTTFKRLLTQHDIVSDFLLQHHTRFFSQYEQLLRGNYATQRQVRRLQPPAPMHAAARERRHTAPLFASHACMARTHMSTQRP